MKTSFVLMLCCMFLTSCGTSYKILKPDTEPGFRLSDYPTFGFFEIDAQGDTVSSTFEDNIGIIKEAVKRNLEQKGLTEAQEPALKVNIGVTVKEKIQTRQTNFQNDGRPLYMGQRRYSWKSKEIEVGRYKEGTMLIDLVDANNNKMVWTAGSEGIIPDKTDNFKTRINEIVDKIFASAK